MTDKMKSNINEKIEKSIGATDFNKAVKAELPYTTKFFITLTYGCLISDYLKSPIESRIKVLVNFHFTKDKKISFPFLIKNDPYKIIKIIKIIKKCLSKIEKKEISLYSIP